MKVFNLLKFQISKNSQFFQSNLSATIKLRDFIIGNKDDAITKFKSTLVPLTDSEPFWDINPKHNCSDRYISDYTNKHCNYGIAEAVENDRIVFSFDHKMFLESPLLVKKNDLNVNISNVTSSKSIVKLLVENVDLIDYGSIIDEDIDENEYFPNKNLTNNLFDAISIEKQFLSRSAEERIASYKSLGKLIGTMNCWTLCEATTNKNDRHIFKKAHQAQFHYLSIDTQHGRFELFDGKGEHIGEYHMYGVLVPDSKTSHSITI